MEFISVGDLPSKEEQAPTFEVLTRTNWEGDIQDLIDNVGHQVTVDRTPDLKRTQIVNAFTDAFTLIGGVPRFAIWADENQTEFYKLWAKLAPRQLEQEVVHDGGMVIQHVLPRGRLDE